jgi:hypothetical protein
MKPKDEFFTSIWLRVKPTRKPTVFEHAVQFDEGMAQYMYCIQKVKSVRDVPGVREAGS